MILCYFIFIYYSQICTTALFLFVFFKYIYYIYIPNIFSCCYAELLNSFSPLYWKP